MIAKSIKKLYLVGIDSTPLWIIEKLSKNYNMKGFELFAKDRMLMDIESTIPPVTSAAWPTIYTGLSPKEHGIIDFSSINKDYEKELLHYESAKYPPFWEVLATKGLRCLVVTPAVALEKSRHKNIDIITGWPLQPRYNSAAIEEIAKRFEFDGEPDIGNALNTGKLSLEEATKQYTESTRKRVDLSKYLMERNNYDMSFVCFTETDRIQHYSLNLKNWEEYVGPVYEEISDFVLYLQSRIEKLNENAVIMVVSDHGAQQIEHKFLSNTWIVDSGYGTLKEEVYARDSQTQKGPISKMKKKLVDKVVESKFRRAIYTKMPRSLQKMGEDFVEDSFDYEHKGKYIRIKESDFDMSKTRAFCSVSFGPMGMIWINDNRFSDPAVRNNAEKNKLKTEIRSKLKKIKDSKGKRLMENIYDGSKYFTTKGSLIAPDIVFELKEGYTSDFSGYSKDGLYTTPEINRRGEHTRFGVFGIKSYNNKMNLKGLQKEKLALTDVSPIILKLFGFNDQKGRSLI